MKFSDLRIVGKNVPLDVNRTQSLRNRVHAFLEAAFTAEPPSNFENPDDGERHIEMDIFVPKSETNDDLKLPLENLSSDESSDSSSDSSDSDSEAVKVQANCQLIEEMNSFEDLNNDQGEHIISDNEEKSSAIGLHPCSFESSSQSINRDDYDYQTNVLNMEEAGVDQSSPVIFVDENQTNYWNPRVALLVDALTSPEFPVTEIPKSPKRPLIEEISLPPERSHNMDDCLAPKRLKTGND